MLSSLDINAETCTLLIEDVSAAATDSARREEGVVQRIDQRIANLERRIDALRVDRAAHAQRAKQRRELIAACAARSGELFDVLKAPHRKTTETRQIQLPTADDATFETQTGSASATKTGDGENGQSRSVHIDLDTVDVTDQFYGGQR